MEFSVERRKDIVYSPEEELRSSFLCCMAKLSLFCLAYFPLFLSFLTSLNIDRLNLSFGTWGRLRRLKLLFLIGVQLLYNAVLLFATQHCESAMPRAKSLSCVRLFVTLGMAACQAPMSMGLSRQNTGVGCGALLQGIFLT